MPRPAVAGVTGGFWMRFRFSFRWLGAAAAALAATTSIAVAVEQTAPAITELDKPVKDFKLTDIMSGKEIALSDFKGKPIVISSISYTCGTSWRYEKRMG